MTAQPMGPDAPTDILGGHMQLRRAAYVSALARFGKSPGWDFERGDDMRRIREARQQLETLRHEQQQIDKDFSLWNKHAHARCANGARWV